MASFQNLLFNIVDSDLLCSICSLDNTGLCYGGKYVLSLCFLFILLLPYSGKVWRGKSLANLVNHLWFTKLKSSNLVLTIDNLLADLLIHQTFFHQMLKKSQFAKLSPHQTFLLYGR